MSEAQDIAVKLWSEFEKQSVFTFKDLKKLQDAFGSYFNYVKDLEISRARWRKRAEDAEKELKELKKE